MLTNLRLGFATNSSSTHSIVHIAGGSGDSNVHDGFGWNMFTAGSKEAKLAWLAHQVLSALPRSLPEDAGRAAVIKLLDLDFDPFADYEGVDHQSIMSMPMERGGWGELYLSKAFLADLSEYLANPDVVVLGGNDNDDEEHDLYDADEEQSIPLPKDSRFKDGQLLCRKEKDKMWTVFNRVDGTRVTFDLGSARVKNTTGLEKTATPLLVDLKITDWCDMGCAFCYQGSTTEGRHAPINRLKNIVVALSQLEVFEVAIGGGEPTAHPNFLEILSKLAYYDITPNFTTRSLKWLKDKKAALKILSYVGGVAFSTENPDQVKKVIEIFRGLDALYLKDGGSHELRPTTKLTFQFVVGATTMETLKGLLKVCRRNYKRATLLGYKTTGRGSDVTPYDTRGLVEMLASLDAYSLPTLGIDTALAKQFKDELDSKDVPWQLYQVDEGLVSMYWDAVEDKIGPSSYCEPSKMVPVSMRDYYAGDSVRVIKEHFATW